MNPTPEAATQNNNRPAVGDGIRGRRIVITRAPHQAPALARLLQTHGAVPVFYPCIDIAPPEETAPMDRALLEAAAGRFDWLILTSANTVRVLVRRLADLDVSLGAIQVAAVGPKTAALATELLRIDVSLVAEEHVAESLAEALPSVSGRRLLLPQSAIARPVLEERLRAAGAEVSAVAAYRTVVGKGGDDVPAMLAQGLIDAVTFTSSSTVRYFLRRLDEESDRHFGLELLSGVCLVAIGPVTAETMRTSALPVDVMPEVYTLSAMVDALKRYYQ